MLDEGPEILNHNVETVPRLYRRVRPDAGYAQSLELLARATRYRAARALSMRTKSGLMVGLGETVEELSASLSDLRAAGCDIATVGQYLQPYERRLPVERYYTPEEFERHPRRRSAGLSARRIRAARAFLVPCAPRVRPEGPAA